MTKPKKKGSCPICGLRLSLVSKHLINKPNVRNGAERRLLASLASGHGNVGGGRCPGAGCGKVVRHLKTHLTRTHKELDREGVEELLGGVRRAEVTGKLAALRASHPDPPMVSRLDLQEDRDTGPSCSNCLRLQGDLEELQEEKRQMEGRQEGDPASDGSSNSDQNHDVMEG